MIHRLCCGLLGLVLVTAAVAESGGAAGEAGYQRCAACHLPGGEGVPGAFPPLKGRIAEIAASDEGRIYLVSVVQAGLMGSITVDGTPYMGVMPAQGSLYDARATSEVLNYAVQVLDAENASADWRPFSAEEVAIMIEAGVATSGQDSARLRQALLEHYPALR